MDAIRVSSCFIIVKYMCPPIYVYPVYCTAEVATPKLSESTWYDGVWKRPRAYIH